VRSSKSETSLSKNRRFFEKFKEVLSIQKAKLFGSFKKNGVFFDNRRFFEKTTFF